MKVTQNSTSISPISKYLVGGLIAGVIGAVIANLWYLIWQAAGGASFAELSVFSITLAALVPALIGALIYYGLTRFTQNPATVFLVAGLIFTTLSILPNFFAPPNPAPGFAAAASPMHYIVALAVLIIVPLYVKNRS